MNVLRNFLPLHSILATVGSIAYLLWAGNRSNRSRMLPPPTWLVVACLPGLISMILLGTLAMHMWFSLGQWPVIGTAGFPRPLLLHAEIAVGWFLGVMTAGILMWAPAVIFCVVVPPWRKFLSCLAVGFLSFMLIFVFIWLLPEGFQKWWLD